MLISKISLGLHKSVLGKKLLFSILVFSTIITLFLTSFQVYLDYKKGIDAIYDRIDQIRLTQLESLTQNLWDINSDQIRIQLKGLLEIKSIKKLQINSVDNESISISKKANVDDPIITKMPLIYKIKDKNIDLGSLVIVSDKSYVLKELQSKIFIILLTQAMKTFLVSLFILFIYNILVNRHLIEIGYFARKLSLDNMRHKLVLHRGKNEELDELDDLAAAINIMQEKFAQEMQQRIEFEKQLRQSQKLEALGTLASGIAHDFNNILQGLYNALFLIEEEVIDNAEALEKLEMANDLTDRARELVKQILIFTRQEEGSFDRFEPIHSIEDVVEILRAASNNKVDIDLLIKQPHGQIYGDQTQLKQVILNIGNNAIQAVEDIEHPKVVIKVSPILIKTNTDKNLDQGNYLKIEVIDNGHGIDKDIIDRVFEPFFTTKEVGRGTGLGLSLVHGIIQRHNGVIKVNSIPNHSTHISIYLPLFLDNAKNLQTKYLGRERVFLISQNTEFLARYAIALQHLEHEVCTFETQEDLIAAINEEKRKMQKETQALALNWPIVIIDEIPDSQNIENLLSQLRGTSTNMPLLLMLREDEELKSLAPNLHVAQIHKLKKSSLQNNKDMAMIFLTRELKYGMNLAIKALNS